MSEYEIEGGQGHLSMVCVSTPSLRGLGACSPRNFLYFERQDCLHVVHSWVLINFDTVVYRQVF